MSIGCRLKYVLCAVITVLVVSPPSRADDWVGGSGVQIASLEPLATYEGGVIRVGLASPIGVPYCGNPPGQASLLQILFTNGTQESRSALVAGLYVALSAGKAVTFLLSSAACSPDGSPVVVGMHVSS